MSKPKIRAFPDVPAAILNALAGAIDEGGDPPEIVIAAPDPQNAIDWALVAIISLWLGDKIAGEFVKQTVAAPIETLRTAIVDAYRWITVYPRPYRSADGQQVVHGPALALSVPVSLGAKSGLCEFIYKGGLDDAELARSLALIPDVLRAITAAGALLDAALRSTLGDPKFYLGPAAPEDFLVTKANERWGDFQEMFVGKWIYHPGDAAWVRAPV